MPRGVPKSSLISRFLRRINKQGKIVSEELGNCWEWQGASYSTGYGQLNKETWGDDYTHRWSYKHYTGEIPEDKLVRHKCDNRCCVNPAHLELGTKQDNVSDMTERHYKPHNRKFSKEIVEEIKKLREEGILYKDISEKYNCNKRTIERIFTGQYYSSI
jgi:hypothetical protein